MVSVSSDDRGGVVLHVVWCGALFALLVVLGAMSRVSCCCLLVVVVVAPLASWLLPCRLCVACVTLVVAVVMVSRACSLRPLLHNACYGCRHSFARCTLVFIPAAVLAATLPCVYGVITHVTTALWLRER